MSFPTLGQLDAKLQLRLRNLVNSPFTQDTRVSALNDVIDFLQSKANWNSTKQVVPFDFLTGEPDYSLANDLGISDFKQFKDLRFVNIANRQHLSEFEEIDGNDFAVFEGQDKLVNRVAFEDRDGDTVMRVLSNWGQGETIIDEMEDLTTGRTWASDTTNSDATTLEVDSTRVKVGSGCFKFNTDVSQGHHDAIIYTPTSLTNPIDASDALNNGTFRFWLGLHSLTATQLSLLQSVDFIWGSDSSATTLTIANYWEKDVTAPSSSGGFKAGWNRMSFDWATAIEAGSPDETHLRYFEIILVFDPAMTDAVNIRVDQIKLFVPNEMELVYFGLNMVQNGTTKQQHFSTTTIDPTEILLFPFQHINLVLNLACQILFPMKQQPANRRIMSDYMRIEAEIKPQLQLAINQSGEAITRATEQLNVEGNAIGRQEYRQW